MFESTLKDYTVVIYKAEEGGYYAQCLNFHGCYTQGETIEEIRENIKEAISLYTDNTDGFQTEETVEEIITIAVPFFHRA
jgi:predicted RNase H-like HicB family nuclease